MHFLMSGQVHAAAMVAGSHLLLRFLHTLHVLNDQVELCAFCSKVHLPSMLSEYFSHMTASPDTSSIL